MAAPGLPLTALFKLNTKISFVLLPCKQNIFVASLVVVSYKNVFHLYDASFLTIITLIHCAQKA
jgi:hypothetical protein